MSRMPLSEVYTETKEELCVQLDTAHRTMKTLWSKLEQRRPRAEESKEQREVRQTLKRLVYYLDRDLDHMSDEQESPSKKKEKSEEKEKPQRRLQTDELRDTAQCRHCLATFPRDSLDWTKAVRTKIGEDDSWSRVNVYTNFVTCTVCNKPTVSDESVEYGK
jgi:hypothetical protein